MLYSRIKMAVSTTPAYYQQVGISIALYFLFRNTVSYLVDFGLTQKCHFLAIFRICGNNACFTALLEPTDAMHESFGPGNGPIAYAGLFVTLERGPCANHIRCYIRRIYSRILIHVG